MRTILIISYILIAYSAALTAQNDFKTLDKQTYDYFMKGDYKNLKKTADTMLIHGMDYYYLRIRLGILAYNKQLYLSASRDLLKAIEFNSLDTISREYIYNSYRFAGRKADANLYLESIPGDKKNYALKNAGKSLSSEFYVGSSASANDVVLYTTNRLNYEAVKNSLSITAVGETYFSSRLKGTFAYTNFRKTGTIYSPSDPSGKDLNFSQNQLYARLMANIIPGWEFSGFGHVAFYSEVVTLGPQGNRFSVNQSTSEYLGGVGISKNGWKIRTEANLSFSNFGHSTQIRGEGTFMWLPKGNLNLYLTSGWMGQTDANWGGTYQASQEIGLKILKSLWVESGLVMGNSFLYARNKGFMINNSFQIPVTTIYSNIIVLPWKHFSISLTPYYAKNEIYSWDLNAYARTDRQTINTFGGAIKLTYKLK